MLFEIMGVTEMRRAILTVAYLAALSACGSDNDPGSSISPTAGAAGEEAPNASEQCPPSFPEFTIGAAGLTSRDPVSGATVRLDSAPKPPEKSFNDWRIVIADSGGAPLADAQLTWACAWMEVHGHGTNPKNVEKLGNGVFNLVDQNFSMYGPWQVRLWIDPTGKAAPYSPQTVSGVDRGNACMPGNGASRTPSVSFDFCVPRSNN